MKKLMLVLGLLLMAVPVMADDNPKSENYNITYDEVNDVTMISHKVRSGVSIPHTGDAIAGHSLNLNVQIRFQGKKYNPADTENTKANLFFIAVHYGDSDENYWYESQDDITLLIDGTKVDLGKADYALAGDRASAGGVTPQEILSVPVDVALLNRIAAATKVEGSITPQRANGIGPFTFGEFDFAMIKNALALLNSLK